MFFTTPWVHVQKLIVCAIPSLAIRISSSRHWNQIVDFEFAPIVELHWSEILHPRDFGFNFSKNLIPTWSWLLLVFLSSELFEVHSKIFQTNLFTLRPSSFATSSCQSMLELKNSGFQFELPKITLWGWLLLKGPLLTPLSCFR